MKAVLQVALGMACLVLARPTLAENVDPVAAGAQYAYGENVGWLNAEPSGDGGPGLQVSEFAVTGYMWGENVGWVSFSCENSASCATSPYGVVNDGGVLGGMAWSENLGWISMSCAAAGNCATNDYGVTIDPVTGVFSGQAWSENAGWISFDLAAQSAASVRTAWTCSQPAAVEQLVLDKLPLDVASLSWSAAAGGTAYDVIRGDLEKLAGTSGNFAQATTDCLFENAAGTSQLDGGFPSAGEGFWYLIRAADCGGGSADSLGAGQTQSRDAGLELADPSASCL